MATKKHNSDYKTFPLGDEQPLLVARQWLQASLNEGAHCPCCGQLAKVYRRSLNATMAMVLVLLYSRFKNESDLEWVHVPTFLNGKGVAARGGDWAKLTYWGVIEAQTKSRDNNEPGVGYYRITDKGKAFVEIRTVLPSAVFVYDGKAQGFSTESITIVEAMKDRFDYNELMRTYE